MGKTPRGREDEAQEPGFMIIGTQNTTSIAGRQVASQGLKRRTHTGHPRLNMTTKEMIKIVQQKGLTPEGVSRELVKDTTTFAKHHQKNGPLGFR